MLKVTCDIIIRMIVPVLVHACNMRDMYVWQAFTCVTVGAWWRHMSAQPPAGVRAEPHQDAWRSHQPPSGLHHRALPVRRARVTRRRPTNAWVSSLYRHSHGAAVLLLLNTSLRQHILAYHCTRPIVYLTMCKIPQYLWKSTKIPLLSTTYWLLVYFKRNKKVIKTIKK